MNIQPKQVQQVDYFKDLILNGMRVAGHPLSFCEVNAWLVFKQHTINPIVINQLLDELVLDRLVSETNEPTSCCSKSKKTYKLVEEQSAGTT